MDALGFLSTLTSFFGSPAFFGGAIFLACLVWITWSTRSGYVLRKLVWRIIHGKPDALDPVIKAFADEQDSLMHFKHHYSLKRVRTLKQAKSVKEWMADNDEGPSTLRKLGDAFDYDEVKVKEKQTKPLGWSIVGYLLMGLAFALVLGFLADFFRGNDAVVTVIKTDNTYAVSKEAARPRAWGRSKTGDLVADLTIEMCGKDSPSKIAQSLQWSPVDVQVLCDLMAAPRSAAYIRDTVRGQKVLVSMFATFTAIAIFFSYVSMRRLSEYQDIQKRQRRRQRKKDADIKQEKIQAPILPADLAASAAL